MEKIVKTLDIATELFSKEGLSELKLSNKGKVELLRELFDLINKEVGSVVEGKVKIQGLGNFVIRDVRSIQTKKIVRRVVFKGREIGE